LLIIRVIFLLAWLHYRLVAFSARGCCGISYANC